MNQAQLDRAVARATQESVGLIRNMGFTLVVTPPRVRYREPSHRKPPAPRPSQPGDRRLD